MPHCASVSALPLADRSIFLNTDSPHESDPPEPNHSQINILRHSLRVSILPAARLARLDFDPHLPTLLSIRPQISLVFVPARSPNLSHCIGGGEGHTPKPGRLFLLMTRR